MHDMNLHEVRQIGEHQVMRVPGGWVYLLFRWDNENSTDVVASTCFVPFNAEFKL